MDLGSLEVPQHLLPIGFLSARMNSAGQLKLPADIRRYLDFFGKEVFITTIDGEVVHIYPIPVWLKNERIIAANPSELGAFQFVAYAQGGRTAIDPQGRLVVPLETRRAMAPIPPGESVEFMFGHRAGCVDMLTQEQANKRLAESRQQALEILHRRDVYGLV